MPLTVVPGGAVTGTLMAPVLPLTMVTTPFWSVAVTFPAASAVAQAPCSASVWASVTSFIWTSGALYMAWYWVSMSLMRSRIV